MICFVMACTNQENHLDLLLSQITNIRKYNLNCKILVVNGSSSLVRSQQVLVCPSREPLNNNPQSRSLLDAMHWLMEQKEEYDYLIHLSRPFMFIKKGFEDDLNEIMLGFDWTTVDLEETPSPAGVPQKDLERWRSFFHCEKFYICRSCIQVYRRDLVYRMMESNLTSWLDQQPLECNREQIVYPTWAKSVGGKHRLYPIINRLFLKNIFLQLDEVLEMQEHSSAYVVGPIQDSPYDLVRQWLSQRTNRFPKQLTIIWGCHQGGLETALHYRLKALNNFGVDAHLFFYHSGTGLSNFSSIPYATSTIPNHLGSYIQKHQFDTVTFVNTLYNLEQLDRISYKGNVFFEFHGYDEQIASTLARINRKQDNGWIQGIIVPSEHVGRLARKLLDQRSELPIYIARNTLDTDLFQRHKYIEDFIIDYKLARWRNSRLIFGWVGRLDTNKNWPHLLQIFRGIKRRHKTAKLLLVSDLSTSLQVHRFFQKAAKYKLLSSIRLLPNVHHNKMPQYYSFLENSGGMLISTSLSEGYPYNILEAIACGCPVVCSAINGSKEIIEHRVTGMTFRTNDTVKAIRNVEILLKNRSFRRSIIKSARMYALSNNNIRHNTLAYLDWVVSLQNNP